ncbi:DUF4123 domain-containing protein [Celerinatantimonas sp. MCCC 1A17872]|uniref:DUF4123 domain-containing protein n=1 Tax=Celerinatantimonas sp. MCCC 1A17872 TaxID=3177514 RepID=UPI0038BFE8B9
MSESLKKIHYVMVLDQLRINDCKAWLAAHNYEVLPLYLDTEWAPQLENSPLLITLEKLDPLWMQWEEDMNWASSGIVYQLRDPMTLDDLAVQLRKNITIKSQNGKLWLWRFYSPKIWKQLSQLLTSQQLQLIQGCASAVHLSPLVSPAHNALVYPNNPVMTSHQLILPDTMIEELIA